MPPLSKPARLVSLAARLTAAVILGQTLFFKLTGAEESRAIFAALGAEPHGRLLAAAAELAAILLLLVPALAFLGALLALGIMAGAIGAHLLVLGVEVQGDGGLLFGLALAVALCALVVLWLHRARAADWLRRGRGRRAGG